MMRPPTTIVTCCAAAVLLAGCSTGTGPGAVAPASSASTSATPPTTSPSPDASPRPQGMSAEQLNAELADLLDRAGYAPLGGDHDIGYATETIEVEVDDHPVLIALGYGPTDVAEGLIADFVTQETRDGGAAVRVGAWSDEAPGAVVSCPDRTLTLRAAEQSLAGDTPAGPDRAEATSTTADRLAAVWDCRGVDDPAAGEADEVGPQVSLSELAQVPDRAIALSIREGSSSSVVVVGLDGTVLGHTPGATFWNHTAWGVGALPGPILVATDDDRQVLVPGGGPRDLTPVQDFPLANGYTVTYRGDVGEPVPYRLLHDGNDTGIYVNDAGEWTLGPDRNVLSWNAGSSDQPDWQAYDLIEDRQTALPGRCRALDRGPAHGLLLGCIDRVPLPPVGDVHDVGRLEWSDGTEVAGAPTTANGDTLPGRYTRAMLDADGQVVLAQYRSSEPPHADWPVFITAGQTPRPAVEHDEHLMGTGTAVGWTPDGRTVIAITDDQHAITAAGPRPGIYLADPDTGELRPLWHGSGIDQAQLLAGAVSP